jgi:hypothetical protein
MKNKVIIRTYFEIGDDKIEHSSKINENVSKTVEHSVGCCFYFFFTRMRIRGDRESNRRDDGEIVAGSADHPSGEVSGIGNLYDREVGYAE